MCSHLINYSKWNKPLSFSVSQPASSPAPALKPDSVNRLLPKLHHAHAPSQEPPALVSPPSEKEASTDGPKPQMSNKDLPSPLSPTLKSLSNQPPNAAHATPDHTHLPQLPKEPDITISLVASQLLSQSNGQRVETPPLNQLEKPRDNPPKKSLTYPTTTPFNQVADALPYAQEPPSEHSDD
jgi:hypothetical protein